VNSGSEANDLALRMAYQHTGNKDVITLDHAYHGHVISLIDISPYKFDLPGADGCPDSTWVAPVPDIYRGKHRTGSGLSEQELGTKYASEVDSIIEEMGSKGGRKPAAFIAESLQSCGGQVIFPDNYLGQVYKSVRDAGGIVIADEVQVGFGRVGTHMWAFQSYDSSLVPDIVTMGKPMGNGHPIAAVFTTPEVAKSFSATGVEYFNTYGGNPVSCAIGNAVLDVIEKEKLKENAIEVGVYLLKQFQEMGTRYQCIGDVRGRGLFVGIDLVKDKESREPATELAKTILTTLKQRHILIQLDGPCCNVIKLKPPMVFSIENAKKLVENVEDILSNLNK